MNQKGQDRRGKRRPQRYRMVAEFTYDWEAWLDPQGRFLYCSPSCQRITGHAADEFLADPGLPRRLIHPEDLARFDEHVLACEKVHQAGEAEWRLIRPDGTCRWMAHACQPVFDGRGRYLGVRSSTRDISDRKQAEARLQESEARYRALFEQAADAIVVFDPSSLAIVDFNDEACRRLGWTRDEFAALKISDFEVLESAAEIQQHSLHVMTAGQADFESKHRTRDGTVLDIGIRASVVRIGDREFIQGIWRDVTDRKRAEQELERLNASLEQRVAERIRAAQMLHDIATLANQTQSPEEAVEYCLRRVSLEHGWCYGHAYLRAADDADRLRPSTAWYAADPRRLHRFHELARRLRLHRGHGLAGRVFASGLAAWTADLTSGCEARRAAVAEELGLRFAIAFPVVVGQQIAGVLEFFSAEILRPEAPLLEAMASVGMHLGRVIERADFEEHLLTIGEEIQRRIAQDLHDDVGQELTGLGLKAETLAEMLADTTTPAGKLAADIAAAVERTRSKVRRFSRNTLPPEMEQGLLAAALEQLAAATTAGCRITCTFDGSTPYRSFDSRVAIHLFRIAQEAVSNAVRHSGARTIHIALHHPGGGAELRIEDDGRGLSDANVQAGGMGLRTMRYRAELIGARLDVGPGPRGGTRVLCQRAATDSLSETSSRS